MKNRKIVISINELLDKLKLFEQKNIISGLCLLSDEQIKTINRNLSEEELVALCNKRPTEKDIDLFTEICKSSLDIYYWFETAEFASLMSIKTNLSYETCLKIFINEANRIENRLLSIANTSKANFLYTHIPHIAKKLTTVAEKISTDYLTLARDKYKVDMTQQLYKSISLNPRNSSKLKVFATYTPLAINAQSAIIIEPEAWHKMPSRTLDIALDLFEQLSVILIK